MIDRPPRGASLGYRQSPCPNGRSFAVPTPPRAPLRKAFRDASAE